MIIPCKELQTFENRMVRDEKPDYRKNLSIVEALYREARAMDAIPVSNQLEGIEIDIELARVINSV